MLEDATGELQAHLVGREAATFFIPLLFATRGQQAGAGAGAAAKGPAGAQEMQVGGGRGEVVLCSTEVKRKRGAHYHQQ